MIKIMENQRQHFNNLEVQQPPVKYCLYARKSTESDELQALSIDSQIKEMQRVAERENLNVVEIKTESHSAKASGQRPVFNQIIADLKSGKFNALLTWAPDRLSRNAGDLGSLVDFMDQKLLVEIKTFNQKFTNSPNEKFMLMILCSQAKLENDNKSLNVKRGMRARVEMGLWPGTAPTGYLNEKRTDHKCEVVIDPERAPIIKQVFEKVGNEQASGRTIYLWLRKDLNFKTKNNKYLSLSNIYILLRNHFYYGVLEYPKLSCNFYTGKHKPIIAKELFDQVQKQLNKERDIKLIDREFAFTKLIKCGMCGSGITAQEKFKNLKDGTVNRYVYYGCTRSKDLTCKSGYIREEELIEQLIGIIDQLDLSEIGMRHKLEQEIERYHKFKNNIFGLEKQENELKTKREINLREYAKYILKEGSTSEKRELMSCLKSRLVLAEKKLTLEK
ncbi:recombinase family protein [Candidatus Parcubacteria bacterium]|nr:MAG: recombinase family protein [Candidatus Parcubacteria bacterium]